jgi:hypothetical protein
MANIKEESLSKALSAKRIPDLPKQYREDSGEYWLEAIVLVRKLNMSQSYAVAKRDADGKISYTADFGDISPISGLISIHPYMYLNKERYMPFETMVQKRHALKEYLGGDEEVIEAVDDMTDEDVEHSLLEIAINSQYAGESIAKTHDAILEAVGVVPKSTIQFEKDEEPKSDEEGTTETDNTDNAEGVDGGNADETTDATELPTDSEATEAVEPKEAEEEKPRNKGGRPRGSKNKTK